MNSIAKNTFLSYFFILVSLFIIVLGTKSIYFEISQNKTQQVSLTGQLSDLTAQYDELVNVQKRLDSGEAGELGLDKYLISFSEDELIDYFHSYDSGDVTMEIDSLSFTDGVVNEVGFREANIWVNARFTSQAALLKFVEVLLSSEKYNFFLPSLNIPYGNQNSEFSLSIPLKVLYK